MRHVSISKVKTAEEKEEFDYLVDLYNDVILSTDEINTIMISKISEVSSVEEYNNFVHKYDCMWKFNIFRRMCLFLFSSYGRGLGQGVIASMFNVSTLVAMRFKEGIRREMDKIANQYKEKM